MSALIQFTDHYITSMTNRILLYLFLAATILSCRQDKKAQAFTTTKYEGLVSLFSEWRKFQAPELVNGIPDYSPAADEKTI